MALEPIQEAVPNLYLGNRTEFGQRLVDSRSTLYPELRGHQTHHVPPAQETGIRFLCNIFGHAADGNFHCCVMFDHGNAKDTLECLSCCVKKRSGFAFS